MSIRWFSFWIVLMSRSLSWAEEAPGNEIEDVTILSPLEVKGVRTEDFGVRFAVQIAIPGPDYVMVSEVFPNTAAAKAGLRPGELITKIDGKSVSALSIGLKPHKIQERKWAELEAGKRSVTWSMEVHAPGAKETRAVALVIPSPAPRWGSKTWSAPEGRTPATVREGGPLATLAGEVMDNGIWSVCPNGRFLGTGSVFENPVLGYEWRIVQTSGTHRLWVTQQRGKTEIILEHRSSEGGENLFLTSPSGALEREAYWRLQKRMPKEISPEEVRARFEAEIDFWLTKVGRVTGRWPFEALAGETSAVTGQENASSKSGVSALLPDSFLKLPVATAVQRELFITAFDKVGLDADAWAFTEKARSLEDGRVTTVRYDPSRPPDERCTLLKVDGKPPKAAYLQQWREQGLGVLPGLGELPVLSSIVDVNDVRIYSDETAAVVFELPVKASNAEFPADKFQAHFRVNKTSRGFEDFSVKLRESLRVAGIAKVTEAGLEARFQTFDPALAPQPVWLKMGGGVRVLFVKVTRVFEVTRADFKRVVPFEDRASPAL